MTVPPCLQAEAIVEADRVWCNAEHLDVPENKAQCISLESTYAHAMKTAFEGKSSNNRGLYCGAAIASLPDSCCFPDIMDDLPEITLQPQQVGHVFNQEGGSALDAHLSSSLASAWGTADFTSASMPMKMSIGAMEPHHRPDEPLHVTPATDASDGNLFSIPYDDPSVKLSSLQVRGQAWP